MVVRVLFFAICLCQALLLTTNKVMSMGTDDTDSTEPPIKRHTGQAFLNEQSANIATLEPTPNFRGVLPPLSLEERKQTIAYYRSKLKLEDHIYHLAAARKFAKDQPQHRDSLFPRAESHEFLQETIPLPPLSVFLIAPGKIIGCYAAWGVAKLQQQQDVVIYYQTYLTFDDHKFHIAAAREFAKNHPEHTNALFPAPAETMSQPQSKRSALGLRISSCSTGDLEDLGRQTSGRSLLSPISPNKLPRNESCRSVGGGD